MKTNKKIRGYIIFHTKKYLYLQRVFFIHKPKFGNEPYCCKNLKKIKESFNIENNGCAAIPIYENYESYQTIKIPGKVNDFVMDFIQKLQFLIKTIFSKPCPICNGSKILCDKCSK